MQKQDLHISFSRKIYDPVTAIATDGNTVKASDRGEYLGRAFLEAYRLLKAKDKAREFLTTVAGTTTTGNPSTFVKSASLPRFDWLISTKVTTGNVPVAIVSPDQRDKLLWGGMTALPSASNVYAVDFGLNIEFYNGASGTLGVTVNYLAYPDTSAMTTDASAVFNPIYNDLIVELATYEYNYEIGELDNAKMNQDRINLIVQSL